ncbi:MAG: tRNA (guanosine(46)-N7)-methyltransferase TrmB [Ostreibacterium sp.]
MTKKNNEKQSKVLENITASPYPSIKSFVRHHGRMTVGQQHALTQHWHEFGIDFEDDVLDLSHFGHFGQVVFEIGFGNGDTFIEMARNSPDTLFIGAEVHKPGIGRVLMLAKQYGLSNIRIIEYDAVAFIEKMLPKHSIDRVHIFFPDPWHKKRHFKRRLIQLDFCQQLYRVLKPAGILHIATDWVPYAEHCVAVINELDFFENLSQNGHYITKPDYRPETKFERRGLSLGHEVRELYFGSI